MNRKCITVAMVTLATFGLIQASVFADAAQRVAPQTAQRAGLIVQFEDGSYIVRCVSFGQQSITGLDLLTNSGLNIATWGTAVCRIGDDGCDYPAQPCFCQCQRLPCRYWSYWHWQQGRWVYSQVGAADYPVHDDDIDGWMWGDGQSPPVSVPFGRVCPPAEATAAGNTPITTRVPATTAEDRTPARLNASQTPGRAANSASAATPAAPLAQYAAFAMMVAVLLGALWLVRNRQQER